MAFHDVSWSDSLWSVSVHVILVIKYFEYYLCGYSKVCNQLCFLQMGNPFYQHNLLNNGYLVLISNRYLTTLICVVNYDVCYILIYKNLLFISLLKLVYLTIFESVLQCFCYNSFVKWIISGRVNWALFCFLNCFS